MNPRCARERWTWPLTEGKGLGGTNTAPSPASGAATSSGRRTAGRAAASIRPSTRVSTRLKHVTPLPRYTDAGSASTIGV